MWTYINPVCHGKRSIQQEESSFCHQTGIKFKEEQVKCYIWSIAVCGAENWSLRKVDQKYQRCFEIWCWRTMEKISWTDRVRNDVLQTVKDRCILYTIKRKGNWIDHILRRKCFRKQVTERKIEVRIDVMGRQ
jgi:hypothetical protein